MLKVTLINPPQHTRYPQPPMGLALIAAILENARYQVSVVDANVLGLKPEEVPPLVKDADVVGLTAMTPTIGAAISIAHHLKQANPGLTIILGGCHATLLPEETLANAPDIDIIVAGEGDKTFIQLLQALEERQAFEEVAGIAFRRDGRVVTNQATAEPVDLDSLPFLAYHLLPWQKYRPHPPHGQARPFGAIITSRGCPYHCSYCSKPIFGSKFRAQSPERVANEIVYHARTFGFKEIAFYDDVFTLNKKRAYAIADEIIKAKLKIDWTCETRVNLVDKDLLHHLKLAGCYAIAYGIESASPDILSTLHKDISLEQVEEAVAVTREADLQTIGYFMLGSPGETTETIQKTIDFAKRLKLDFAQFAITTPFPGTELYDIYIKGGNSKIPWESFVYAGAGSSTIHSFTSNGLSRDELQKWVSKAYKKFYLRPSYLWQRVQRMTSIGDLKVNINGLSLLLDSIRQK